MIYKNIFSLIGNTPVVKINKIFPKDIEVYAKLEWFNIGGSVKDRTVFYLLEDKKIKEELKKGKEIIEATSGNTGISLSMMAAVKGIKVTIVMPDSVSKEKKEIIKIFGAKLILSKGEKGTAGAIELKERLLRENPEKYVDLGQYKNERNILAHYETTAKEIINDFSKKLEAVIVGIGTAGTAIGISKRLKQFNKKIKIIGVVPEKGVSIEGLRNPKDKFATRLFNKKYFDEIYEIKKTELPLLSRVALLLARKEGLFCGISSSAVTFVALKKVKEKSCPKTLLLIFPDSGIKYLTTNFYS